MSQTLWNLCPFTTPFTSACYYTSDNSFSPLVGTSSSVSKTPPKEGRRSRIRCCRMTSSSGGVAQVVDAKQAVKS